MELLGLPSYLNPELISGTILSDGYGFINPVDGELEKWLLPLNHWQKRILLTPAAIAEWNFKEAVLSRFFSILPFNEDGFIQAKRYFEEMPTPSLREWKYYLGRNDNPLTIDEEQVVISLENKLSPEVMSWLTACAVFPELHWDLTLELGYTISNGSQNIVTFQNLMTLSRLKWFRQGFMPTDIRRQLLNSRFIDGEKRRQARFAILRILETNPPAASNSYAADEHRLHLAINSFLLSRLPQERQKWLKIYRDLHFKGVKEDLLTSLEVSRYIDEVLDFSLPQRIWEDIINGKRTGGLVRFSQFLKDIPQNFSNLGDEEEEWRKAISKNSLDACHSFLNSIPHSKYRVEAIRRINNLIKVRVSPIEKLESDMVPIKGGAFIMGCQDSKSPGNCYEDEKPTRQVHVQDFLICRFVVNQNQWRFVMGYDPEFLFNKGVDDCPVERISWNDVQEFIKRLNKLTGKQYRLPTEAEWEYVARGGNQSQGNIYSGSMEVEDSAWYFGNYRKGNTFGQERTTHPVGAKKPNELGIFDMSGNVWELCEDDWHSNYQGGPKKGNAWVDNPRAHLKVSRGGSWSSSAKNCRVTSRLSWDADIRVNSVGFRLAHSLL